MLKSLAILFILMCFCSCALHDSSKKKVTNSPVNIMAYYVPEREYHPEKLPLDKITHIIYSFSKVIDGEMKFPNEESGRKLKLLVAQKEMYPHLKVMIACGGWGADGFSDAAHSVESRKKFIASSIAFVEEYNLDGIDMDWEYPAIPAAGTKARPDDKENFTALLKGLREALDETGRPQVLTFASAGWKRYYDNVELLNIMKHVDYMNVMTYDQAGGASRFTSHHTALGRAEVKDLGESPLGLAMKKRNAGLPEGEHKWEPQSVEKIIDFCIEKGVNPKQLVVGAAFYGRGWKGVPSDNNGLYQPNKGAISGGTNYHVLVKDFISDEEFENHWDPVAKAPYLYNSNDSIFITYDDTRSVALKTRYAKEKKLGGIMFWQLSGDTRDENSLLDAIFEEAIK